MAAHEETLAAVRRIAGGRSDWTFTPDEIVRALPHLNPGTVRTHITSRCCSNATADEGAYAGLVLRATLADRGLLYFACRDAAAQAARQPRRPQHPEAVRVRGPADAWQPRNAGENDEYGRATGTDDPPPQGNRSGDAARDFSAGGQVRRSGGAAETLLYSVTFPQRDERIEHMPITLRNLPAGDKR
jgi:hypothetical protein